jgi:hypothetical protein
MAAGMNWSFRLVLGNPEAPGHGDVVFLVFIPPEPQGAWCGGELIAWKIPELSKTAHGMATPPIISIAIKPVIPNTEDLAFVIHGMSGRAITLAKLIPKIDRFLQFQNLKAHTIEQFAHAIALSCSPMCSPTSAALRR